MAVITQYHGSLVAFEGPQDTISTQLRLLPNSPNILIVPPLRYFLKEEDLEAPFDARAHILAVHKACHDRVEAARAFLQDSTPSDKRLVFMNGGTVSAQLDCITDISHNLTDGDFAKAERMFHGLVRNGVQGLHSRRKKVMSPKALHVVDDTQETTEKNETPSDPASKAMRAADALDLQTASLQPNNEVDLTTKTRSRSTSVPPYRVVDDFQNATPFYVFGACKWEKIHPDGPNSPQIPHRSHTIQETRKASRRGQNVKEPRRFELVSKSKRQSLSPMNIDLTSPRSLGADSTVTTPAICEAFVVDLRPSASTASHRKPKSVDRTYSNPVRKQDILLRSFPRPPRSRPQSLENSSVNQQEKLLLRSKYATEIPRPTFSTPNRSMVRRSPPSPLKLQKILQRPVTYVDRATSPIINRYVDHGTSTEPEPTTYESSETETEDLKSPKLEDSFGYGYFDLQEAVLPLLEDLVIFFKTENPDTRLEETIQAFKEGAYPISISRPIVKAEEERDRTGTFPPELPRTASPKCETPISDVRCAEVMAGYHTNSDEYDPFAYETYPRPSCPWSSTLDPSHHKPCTPPTPAQTPPLPAKSLEKRFHEFTTTSCRTAVCMQNSLRSILNIYFPPEDTGYHQFNFPLLPELGSLWKPVFRDTDTGAVTKRKRKIDLILAIGAQQGVDKDFLAAITGSLEKLGTKPNGMTRSGRLDLRLVKH